MPSGFISDQRVEAVLGGHDVGHLAVAGQHADAADAPLLGLARLEQPVDVHRLVRAVEAADAEMHYADADLAAVVGRLRDRDLGQGRVVELHDTITTVLTLPGARSESGAIRDGLTGDFASGWFCN